MANEKELLDKLNEEDNNITAPSEYICPCTHLIFKNPVVLSDGYTYEKDFVLEFFNDAVKKGIICRSPMTGSELKNTIFYDNFSLKTLIADFLEKNPEQEKEQHGYIASFCEKEKKIMDQIEKKNYKIVSNYKNYDLVKMFKYSFFESFIENCSYEIMFYFLDNVIDINARDINNGNTLAHYFFTNCRSVDNLLYLMNKKPQLDIKNNDGDTPIHYVFHNNLYSIISYIDNKYFEIENNKGDRPIHSALLVENSSIIYDIMMKNKNINFNGIASNGKTILNFLINSKPSMSRFNMAIERCNVGECDKFGVYPIHVAAMISLEFVNRLLLKNINFEVEDIDGLKPVHYAALYGPSNILFSLMSKGSSYNSINKINGYLIESTTIAELIAANKHFMNSNYCSDKTKKIWDLLKKERNIEAPKKENTGSALDKFIEKSRKVEEQISVISKCSDYNNNTSSDSDDSFLDYQHGLFD